MEKPIYDAIKGDIVVKTYYRWDHQMIVDHIIKKYRLESTDLDWLINLITEIEKEVTNFRLKLGRIS
jgi:hypothetical protein